MKRFREITLPRFLGLGCFLQNGFEIHGGFDVLVRVDKDFKTWGKIRDATEDTQPLFLPEGFDYKQGSWIALAESRKGWSEWQELMDFPWREPRGQEALGSLAFLGDTAFAIGGMPREVLVQRFFKG
jgi:hypothetical protein